MAPSGNINPGGVSLFEPVHGSAPDIAGKGMANPMGAVLAAAIMMEHLGWTAEPAAVRRAVRAALLEGQVTADLGGTLGTRQAGDSLAERVVQDGGRKA